MTRAFRRFLAACAWRVSDLAMTLAMRLDPELEETPEEARASADRVRAAMLRAVEKHRAAEAIKRSRPIHGNGLN